MKLLQRLSGLTVAAGIVLAPGLAIGLPTGANPGFAGHTNQADGTPRTCAVSGCHASFELNAGTGSVHIDAPADLAGGQRATVTVTLDNQTPLAPGASRRRQGFEATVRDPETGDLWGTLAVSDAANTRYTTGSEAYVTHTEAGNAQTVWTFDWDPGTARSGRARVYVASVAGNGVGSSGDYVYAATADVLVAPVAEEARPEVAFTASAPRPNPIRSGGVAVLDLSLRQPGAVSVRLVDGVGRTVRLIAQAERGAGATPVTVPTYGLAAGTYFVVVEGPGGRRTVPLAVAR